MYAEKWTTKECEWLLENIGKLPRRDLAQKLGRSETAVNRKFYDMTRGEMVTKEQTFCQIFDCGKRGGNPCCCECHLREKCRDVCLNSPERCGQAMKEKVRERKHGK